MPSPESFTDAERERARRDFAERFRGQERDGWGPFTFEAQGEVEQAHLMQVARAKGDDTMSKCKSCGQAIIWAKTESGKNAPFDPAPQAGPGRFWVIGTDGVARLGGFGEEGRTNHFATCPSANQHRKPKPVRGEFGA